MNTITATLFIQLFLILTDAGNFASKAVRKVKEIIDYNLNEGERCEAIFERSKKFYKALESSKKYSQFFESFGLKGRLKEKYDKQCSSLLANVDGTRVIMHEEAKKMIEEYLSITKSKQTFEEFVKHLIKNRTNSYFTSITDRNLTNQAYDEMLLSSMLIISSPSNFYKPSNYPANQGIITGIVPPHFEYNGLDEKFLIIRHNNSPSFLTSADKILKEYYYSGANERKSFKEIKIGTEGGRYKTFTYQHYEESSTNKNAYFDMHVYKKRLSLWAIPFFKDANERAKKNSSKALVYVSELACAKCNDMDKLVKDIFLEEIVKLIEEMHNNKSIANIERIYFSGSYNGYSDKYQDGFLKKHGPKSHNLIKIINNTNNTNSEITIDNGKADEETDEDKEVNKNLIVTSFAFNGKFFSRQLDENSEELLAINGSDVADFQNPKINKEFTTRISIFS